MSTNKRGNKRKLEKNNAKTKRNSKQQTQARKIPFPITAYSHARSELCLKEIPSLPRSEEEMNMLKDEDEWMVFHGGKAKNPEADLQRRHRQDWDDLTNSIKYTRPRSQRHWMNQRNKNVYLTKEALQSYSPKFLNILENVTEQEYSGPHLIQSIRTLEGTNQENDV